MSRASKGLRKLLAALLFLACCGVASAATPTTIDWGTGYGASGFILKTTHVSGAGTACANGQKAFIFLNVGYNDQTAFTIQNADGTASSWTNIYFDVGLAAGSELFAAYYHDCGASEQAGGYKVTDFNNPGGTHSGIVAFVSGAPVGSVCKIGSLATASAATSINPTVAACGPAPLTLGAFGNDATGEVFTTATSGWSSVTNNGSTNNPGITLLQAAAGSTSVTATVTPTSDSLFARVIQVGTAPSLPASWIGAMR